METGIVSTTGAPVSLANIGNTLLSAAEVASLGMDEAVPIPMLSAPTTSAWGSGESRFAGQRLPTLNRASGVAESAALLRYVSSDSSEAVVDPASIKKAKSLVGDAPERVALPVPTRELPASALPDLVAAL